MQLPSKVIPVSHFMKIPKPPEGFTMKPISGIRTKEEAAHFMQKNGSTVGYLIAKKEKLYYLTAVKKGER